MEKLLVILLVAKYALLVVAGDYIQCILCGYITKLQSSERIYAAEDSDQSSELGAGQKELGIALHRARKGQIRESMASLKRSINYSSSPTGSVFQTLSKKAAVHSRFVARNILNLIADTADPSRVKIFRKLIRKGATRLKKQKYQQSVGKYREAVWLMMSEIRRIPVAPECRPAHGDIELEVSICFIVSRDISDAAAFLDKNSPQYIAAEWITNEDVLGLDFTDAAQEAQWIQRYRLACFYFATNGDYWRECGRHSERCSGDNDIKTWLTGDECEWFSVGCQRTPGVVDVLNFNNPFGNFLEGELPPEFFQLSDLFVAFLQSNQLQGTMSELWGELTDMEELLLINNNYTGTVPEVFWKNNRKLKKVMFGLNSFEGQISTHIAGLPLQNLRFESNKMTGSIPDELFGIASLLELRLTNNTFTGTLSEKFVNLAELTSLLVAENEFSGPIPTALDRLSGLRELKLYSNLLTGSISNTICFLIDVIPEIDCDLVECLDGCCECHEESSERLL